MCPALTHHTSPCFSPLSSSGCGSSSLAFNPLKQVQLEIAPTRHQRIILNRRKNFQLKKKTELCKDYLLGRECPLGERCSFAHGYEELKPRYNASVTFKTIKCKHYHDQMFCQYGPRCQFLHNDHRGEIREIRLNYLQLMSVMEDCFKVAKMDQDSMEIGDFLDNCLSLKAIQKPRLVIFEALQA